MTSDAFIPLAVPHLGGNEWKYVKECLDTNWVSSVGTYVDRFEVDLASYVGRERAVATTSGTAALHLALMIAGVGQDDEVLVSDMTFIAPANAIRYVGAFPVFVDADPAHWEMDAHKLADFMTSGCEWKDGALINRATQRRIRAIMPVHILGHPCDMDPILELARQYDLKVIEDATESLGALYKGRPVGSHGDIACFSFNGNKVITTGGGGMLVTDSQELADRARYLSTQAKDDPIEYVHGEVGYNYRLTNVQAAIGVAQMEQLDEFVAKKRHIADAYRRGLAHLPGVTVQVEAEWADTTSWLSTVLFDAASYGRDARSTMEHLQKNGIQTRPLWQPMHSAAPFADCFATDCSISERLYGEALSLPSSVDLTDQQLEKIIRLLGE